MQAPAPNGWVYSWPDFVSWYGPHAERMWDDGRAASVTAEDGQQYTWEEFEEFYGTEAKAMWRLFVSRRE
jgi:hypothetical protein